MRRKNYVCAFLDLLGFRTYIGKDLRGAANLIMEYKNVLDLTLMAQNVRAPRTARGSDLSQSPALQNHNLQLKVTSFDYFLPFSDSIFIRSSNPDLFVAQISSFLSKCLTLINKGHEFDETSEHPFQTGVRDAITHKKGRTIAKQVPVFSWPVLFRGGISYGDCHPMKVTSILNGLKESATILAGNAVVEAVQFERRVKGSGPMLMCSKSFYNSLSKEGRKYVEKVRDHYEILWPAFRYYDDGPNSSGDFRHAQTFEELFRPAAIWWNACNHLEYASHYYNLLKLIIRSTLHYYSLDGRSVAAARRHIETRLKEHGLLSKAADLMKKKPEVSL